MASKRKINKKLEKILKKIEYDDSRFRLYVCWNCEKIKGSDYSDPLISTCSSCEKSVCYSCEKTENGFFMITCCDTCDEVFCELCLRFCQTCDKVFCKLCSKSKHSCKREDRCSICRKCRDKCTECGKRDENLKENDNKES